jgi:hypothetical protein
MVSGNFRRIRSRRRRPPPKCNSVNAARIAFNKLVQELSGRNRAFYELFNQKLGELKQAVNQAEFEETLGRLIKARIDYLVELKRFSIFKKIFSAKILEVKVDGLEFTIPLVSLKLKSESNPSRLFIVFDSFFRKLLVLQVPDEGGSHFSVVSKINDKSLHVSSITPKPNSVEGRLIQKIQSNLHYFEDITIEPYDSFYVFDLI